MSYHAMDEMPGHSMSHTTDNSMTSSDMHHDMCSMNMLFTWDYTNTCVVFKWWHIRSTYSFLVSFVAIVALSLGYELSRNAIALWESRNLALFDGLASGTSSRTVNIYKFKKSLMYGFQIGYSFMLMLVFMTYNGWLMLAVVLGGAVGHFFWGSKTGSRGLQCH